MIIYLGRAAVETVQRRRATNVEIRSQISSFLGARLTAIRLHSTCHSAGEAADTLRGLPGLGQLIRDRIIRIAFLDQSS
jgi:hypothetical protein